MRRTPPSATSRRISGSTRAYSASKFVTPAMRCAASRTAAGVVPWLANNHAIISSPLPRAFAMRAAADALHDASCPGIVDAVLKLHSEFHGQSLTTYLTAPGLDFASLSKIG